MLLLTGVVTVTEQLLRPMKEQLNQAMSESWRHHEELSGFKIRLGDSLVALWIWSFHCWGLIPGWGAKILQAHGTAKQNFF